MTEDINMAIANYISDGINELAGRKSQKEISKEAGYPAPNILSMLKQGQSKLALDRVVSLSRALEKPPEELFRMVMERIYPDPADNPLITIFRGVIPSQTEVAILHAIRSRTGGSINLQPNDEKLTEIVDSVVSILKK